MALISFHAPPTGQTDQGKGDEARDWAQRILANKATMPRYLRGEKDVG